MVLTNVITEESRVSPYDLLTTPDQRSLRYGVWPIPKEKRKGSILLLSGRKEFMEKYSETIDELNQKGVDVYCIFKETDAVRSIIWREFNRFTHAK
jgi:alpha-beta hydrolase superfamily lysophospholipase